MFICFGLYAEILIFSSFLVAIVLALVVPSRDTGEEQPLPNGTAPGSVPCTDDPLSASGADGRVEWEIGEEDDKPTDGESERETEGDDEMLGPDEESSAEDSMPELEDIATAATDISLSEQQKDAADDSTTTPGNENGTEKASEGEDAAKEEKPDEDQVNDNCGGAEEEQEKDSPDAVKEESDLVQAAAEVQADTENGEAGKEKEQERTEASAPPEPVVAKKSGTTKVLKKKKKKTRSQPPSIFSCPFMTSEMMEPSEQSRGPWRRRERGKPKGVYGLLADGKSKADREEATLTEAPQHGANGEDPGKEGNIGEEEKKTTSPVPDSDDDVKKVKEEIYEEACPQRKVYKEAERGMTDEDRETERRIQREQLAAIFKLMQDNEDKFGVQSYDDVEEQMKLYKT
ncbi:PREDICTED: trans-Golgi network integral membrane protein 2-like [Branchiostoma belcheri]|uniref:Trans-Golgi network integral membrane protein 2-like n=1 Tax=Branchiostoma belcheri TaxID=7741 RepID=A0A6P4ZLI4_BRABE|nr:PREDICTED: trans-Golgi network integral membrane protein 2-like [Branchiostoma belcheri]